MNGMRILKSKGIHDFKEMTISVIDDTPNKRFEQYNECQFHSFQRNKHDISIYKMLLLMKNISLAKLRRISQVSQIDITG